jgi:hypothetical protein
MQEDILKQLKEISSSKKAVLDGFEEIKALYTSKTEANKLLAIELMQGKGYTPFQAQIVLALMAEQMHLDDRIAYQIVDGQKLQIEGFAFGLLDQKELNANKSVVSKLINKQLNQLKYYPQEQNVEYTLSEKESYFYVLLLVDGLPLCILGETTEVSDPRHWNYGVKHLLSLHLLSEIPKDIIMLPPIPTRLEMKVEIEDHLMDWVNFAEREERSTIEIIIESMDQDQWGLGIGFYNEKNKYISILDLEINQGVLEINQEDIQKLREAYPQFLTPIAYHQDSTISTDEMRHIWTYNVLKNYL